MGALFAKLHFMKSEAYLADCISVSFSSLVSISDC